MALAIVLSATVAVKPASAVGLAKVDTVACSVESALLKVPNADSCAFSVVCWFVISVCWPAPSAVVRADTIAVMLSPEPMPVEVISELPAAAPEVEELVGVVDEEIAELIKLSLPVLDLSIYRQRACGLKQSLAEMEARNIPSNEELPHECRPYRPAPAALAAANQARLSTSNPEAPMLRAKAGNSLAANWAITAPLAGLTS